MVNAVVLYCQPCDGLRSSFPCSSIVVFFLADTGYGTIYTSDDQGIIYSKSLERHLYTTTRGETDFTNVTSLRGIYITSVLSEGELTLAG